MKTALTPLDGRYYARIEKLVPYLSEDALIKYRVHVEIEWLIALCGILLKPFTKKQIQALRLIIVDFDADTADEIREIESTVNHDVKAVEIWLGKVLTSLGLETYVSLVHFGRTSEDINNLAYALMLKDARQHVLIPALNEITSSLQDHVGLTKSMPMLAKTHGQPATPTTLGKELAVFYSRITMQIELIHKVTIYGKFNGATGTYAADFVAYPDIGWPRQMSLFVKNLGLDFNPLTTQIEPHDWIARLCNELSLSGTIMIDLSRDCWQYISLGYLTQRVVAGEVGSSTMPHKVNPIDFENAEANFGVANALLRHLSEKLPISRLQRDLSDSSALRSLSEALGHYLLALGSLKKGLSKVTGNEVRMRQDLKYEWAVLTEAIQTILRKNGVVDAYDQMKKLSRGKEINEKDIHELIATLDIDPEDKKRLLALTPSTYIGLAATLAQ